MKASPILTDDNARQWQYVDGNLYRLTPRPWHPATKPEDIEQGILFRSLYSLLNLASKVRW